MSFGATPLDGSTPAIPMSSVVPDGSGTPVALEGGPVYSSDASGNKAPVSMYVKDGNHVTMGTTTQTKATDATTTSWSVIQLLKGILNSLLTTIAVTQSGTWTVQQGSSATGTPTSIAGNASAVQLLASNGSRKGAYIYNDSSATLYIGFFSHTSLTTSTYTAQVPAGNLFEMPTIPVYTGEISGIWSSAAGNARITEMS